MKFGLCLPNFGGKIGPGELLALAVAAEENGFASVWATDHIIMPRRLKSPYDELFEPFVTLASIAAKTSEVKLGTSVLVLPQRDPFLVAKQVATLDQFSGGRMILGVGAGWAEGEFEYLGANFRKRGKVLDEAIDLLRRLWTDSTINYSGRFFRVSDAVTLPKPVQKIIPIWVGRTSDAAIERAARVGDGWHPVGVDPARLAQGAARVKKTGTEKTISVRLTVDVRRRREDYVSPDGEKMVTLSGSREEMARTLEEYAKGGLEYLVAYIYRDEVREIIADVMKFSGELIRSYS